MRCDLGDLAIHYETYGAGRPIVMLLGRPSDHRVMTRFMEPLFAQRAGHFINIEQDTLCRTLMREWLDRVEEGTAIHAPRARCEIATSFFRAGHVE